MSAPTRKLPGWRKKASSLARLLEIPMIILAALWLALLVVELVHGLSPTLTILGQVIWIIFVLDFMLRYSLAPRKLSYLKRNWLTAASLAIPALRVFRVARVMALLKAARTVRGIRLLKVVSTANRSLRAAARGTGREGAPYVVLATLMVLFAGSAGMYAFEGRAMVEDGFSSYADALWWTAMLITTIGSSYWPVTSEGRILCLFLSMYSLGVLGYLTAYLASFLIGRRTGSGEGTSLAEIQADIRQIQELLRNRSGNQKDTVG